MNLSVRVLITDPIAKILGSITHHLNDDSRAKVFGAEISNLSKRGTGKTLANLCLFGDCLRITTGALYADSVLSDEEAQATHPFIKQIASLLAKYRAEYKQFIDLDVQHVGDFLKFYQADEGLFGYRNNKTKWAGFTICSNVASICNDWTAFDRYEKMAIQLTSTILSVDGITKDEANHLKVFVDKIGKKRQAIQGEGKPRRFSGSGRKESMKIAVTADVHLREGHPERYSALENIFEQTEAENINTLFIAGDLFDKDFQNYQEFESLCKKHPGIHLHIIPGNHDPDISGKSIVGKNIHIYTSPTTVEIHSITFLFLPYKEKKNMGEKIAEMESEIEGKQWVLIAHGDYYEGVKELNPLEPGTYMPLSKKTIEKYRPQTVFLGHIHKSINWKNNVYYTGSPCGLDISETGKRKFLVYNTVDRTIVRRDVKTDVLYFKENFIIVPKDNEVPLLKEEIGKRIESWKINSADYSKVSIRVEAAGYTTDKSAIQKTLEQEFKIKGIGFYKDEGPKGDDLFVNSDHQLNAIADRAIQLIDKLDWNFGGDEPEQEQVKTEALSVIYGT